MAGRTKERRRDITMSKEYVLVKPTKLFDAYINISLVRGACAARLLYEITRKPQYLEREFAETNVKYRQIIPYVVVQQGDKVLMMTRTSKQGEQRLHGKVYIGVGGHIQEPESITEGVTREVTEEIGVNVLTKRPGQMTFQGIIIDDVVDKVKDGVPVCKVHAGILFHLILDKDHKIDFKCLPEYDTHLHRWVKLSELRKLAYDSMEGWSKIVTDCYL
jgi:predicted NUDIX family phosphoesterase